MPSNPPMDLPIMENSKPTLLDNVEHHDLRLIPGHSAAWGDAVNQVRVYPNEFAEVQREYPIFFRKDAQGSFYAVALLGFDRDENLFLDGMGWNARYIPAERGRGPFLLGFREGAHDDTPMVLIDPLHPRLSRNEGIPLFLPHGGNAPLLEHHIQILQTLHSGLTLNDDVFGAWLDAGLLAPVKVDIQINDDTGYDIPDLFSINAEALAKLDGAVLAGLNARGYLGLAFQVLTSLANVQQLIALKSRNLQGA
ncbi:SapC family protein [Asticcacaulis sp. AC466]|uniref:SapC family protein n=1 Tax=Asticcacaulis sp. AC466 TaxID=1282362 RepID=UPI001F27718F|nr:SapC family protein [Asticcacaulis sp. AC466]